MVFFLYLRGLGLSDEGVGALLTLILIGDLAITLYLTTSADRLGRKRTLALGSLLMLVAGVAFGVTGGGQLSEGVLFAVLVVAGTIGVVSPSGGEIGPFLSVEQAALTDIITATAAGSGSGSGAASAADVATAFGWHTAAGYLSSAAGAVAAGGVVSALEEAGQHRMQGYRAVVIGYGVCGIALALLYLALSPAVEAQRDGTTAGAGSGGSNQQQQHQQQQHSDMAAVTSDASLQALEAGEAEPLLHLDCCSGRLLLSCSVASRADRSAACRDALAPLLQLCGARGASGAPAACCGLPPNPRTRSIVARLSLLFSLDAFAGGLAMQSFLVFWLASVWQLQPVALGSVVMAANIISAISGVVSGWLVKRVGAINTAVFTHAPSNVLLMLVPLMPSAEAAVAMLLLRFCISQMDVPARQAYLALSVSSAERSAAGGVTAIARSVGLSLAPTVLGLLTAAAAPSEPRFSAPLYLAGVLKLVYDAALYYSFRQTAASAAAAPASTSGQAKAKAAAAAPPAAPATPAAAGASKARGAAKPPPSTQRKGAGGSATRTPSSSSSSSAATVNASASRRPAATPKTTAAVGPVAAAANSAGDDDDEEVVLLSP